MSNVKVSRLIGLVGAMLLAFALTANAQQYPSVSSTGYGSVGSTASYGSYGSAAAAYGSSGSAAFVASRDFRPLRSILENRPIRSRLSAVASVASATPAAMSSAYQVALASAQARSASRRRGYARSIEAGYTVGVGFSTFDSTPWTCLGVGGPGYAVARGADGWYATKVE